MKITLICYRQGNTWMINQNGQLRQLPYFIQTKSELKEWVKSSGSPTNDYQFIWAR